MKYVTGIFALNLPCSLLTCGDWHCSALRWNNVNLQESTETVFGDYGIETDKEIPEHEGKYNVANHIRALLDILVDGKLTLAQGMCKDFICNDDYSQEIFEKVLLLKDNANWKKIDEFMKKEYMLKWINYTKTLGKKNIDVL